MTAPKIEPAPTGDELRAASIFGAAFDRLAEIIRSVACLADALESYLPPEK